MRLDGLTVNANVPAAAFVRQSFQGVKSFNLATQQIDGAGSNSLQQAQGFGESVTN